MNNKFYLVFTPDNGDREDCNVFYSYLVQAHNKQEAFMKLDTELGYNEGHQEWQAREMTLIS